MEDAYSFVGWIASLLVYIWFLLWAFLPSRWLHSMGVTYYPSRYYAIALPAYLMVLYFLVGFAYIGYNMWTNVHPTDFASFRDKESRDHPVVPLVCQKFSMNEGIPEVGDIDPVEISKLWK